MQLFKNKNVELCALKSMTTNKQKDIIDVKITTN